MTTPSVPNAPLASETPQHPDRSLTRGRLLARNILLNLGGHGLPAIAAILAMPVLAHRLGDVRLGLLLLAWTTLGYFGLFDFGIGRAVTHAVADRVGRGRQTEVGVTIWTALLLLLPVSLFGAVLLFVLAPWLALLLEVPANLRGEATTSFRVLSLAIPFVALSGALRGALEARQLFGIVNALRIPHGLITFVGPLFVLPFSRSLVPAMFILTAGRVAVTAAQFAAVWRRIPRFARAARRWDAGIARRLAMFGGWTQVTYIVSPAMVTLDRFVIGAVLGVGVVTYYAVPFELVTKLWAVPVAVLPVFFSALATTAERDAARTVMMFDRLMRLSIAAVFVPSFLLVVLAPDILRVWLDPGFAHWSTAVMQVLTIGVYVNCVGQAGYTLVQGLGRPDVTGKFHLMELPVYGLLLWWLLPRYGITGVAIAWSARTLIDSALLLGACPALLPGTRAVVVRFALMLVSTTLVLLGAMLLSAWTTRALLALVVIPGWGIFTWRRLLTPAEREMSQRFILA